MKRLAIVAVVLALIGVAMYYTLKPTEGFDGLGMYVQSPLWMRKPAYNADDWKTTVYPDRIQASCLPYSIQNKYNQGLDMLNYWSQAYSLWRF